MWVELAPQVDALGVYTESMATGFRGLVEIAAAWRYPEPDIAAHIRVRIFAAMSAMLSKFGLDPASRDRVTSLRAKDDGAGDEVPMFGIKGVVEGGNGA